MPTPTPATQAKMDAYVKALLDGMSKAEARNFASVSGGQMDRWRASYPVFASRADQAYTKSQADAKRARADALVYDHRRARPKWPSGPRLDYWLDWRTRATGRPTPPHVMPFVRAYFDLTNRRIIWKGPSGGGKDTTLGDIVLSEIVHDRTFRVGWLNESDPLATRRVAERIKPYLENPRTYEAAPGGPGTTVPTMNLIEKFGPFTWTRGLKYPNGDPVPKNTWEKRQLYFLPAQGEKEQDPNLSAAGIGSALEGQRIRLFVMSDVFTLRNHGNPTVMDDQIANINGTIANRLDGSGRVVLINHRVGPGDNIERLEREWIGSAEPIEVVHEGTSIYEKYPNGTAVITTQAIGLDDEGNEVTFWPDNPEFPLDSYLELDGERYDVEEIGAQEQLRLARLGAIRVDGLRQKRRSQPRLFATMQQQDPPNVVGGEFTDMLLDSADDPDRSIGIRYAGEIGVLGVDPARTYGAAYVKVAVNLAANTIIPYDVRLYSDLGSAGIKNKLVLSPLREGGMRYMAYERNRESWVLDDLVVQETCRAMGIEIVPLYTNNNLNEGEWSVSAMAEDIAQGVIKFPAQTLEDREFMAVLKQHAQNWDHKMVTGSKPGRSGHRVDDAWMAFWNAWKHAKFLLNSRIRRDGNLVPSVPVSIQRRWGNVNVDTREVQIDTPHTDLVEAYYST